MDNTEDKKIGRVARILSVSSKVLLGAIIALLAFVAAVLAYDKFVKKSAIPSFFGRSLLVIATPSMTGSVDAGDAIIIKKSATYEVGDVITYFPAGESVSVTHRIVRIEGEKYYAKGDANEAEDPDPIFLTQIAGKMTVRLPNLGIIIEWLRTWQGVAFIVSIGAVVVALVMVAHPNEEARSAEETAADNGDDRQ